VLDLFFKIGYDAYMMKERTMNPITLSQREYATLVAGYEPSDEEIYELMMDYEDWVRTTGDTGDYEDAPGPQA
jgi:hypothetical protein